MYQPNPASEFRVKFDFRVDFTNGGYVEGHDFLLDVERPEVSDTDLAEMIVEAMNLARAGRVRISAKRIVRRGEHDDAALSSGPRAAPASPPRLRRPYEICFQKGGGGMPAVRNNRWVRYGWKLHRWLYRATKGRIGGHLGGWPVLLLTTTGRRSGRPITTALSYLRRGDKFIVAASNAGEPAQPSWYLNLKAQPLAQIQVGAAAYGVVANDAGPTERDALWQEIVVFDPSYAEYQARTTRRIPVVFLSPRA